MIERERGNKPCKQCGAEMTSEAACNESDLLSEKGWCDSQPRTRHDGAHLTPCTHAAATQQVNQPAVPSLGAAHHSR